MGRGCAAAAIFFAGNLVVAASSMAADRPLFPAPLHITRELTNPVSGTKSVVDEYCHGNRVVAVSGRRTSIADYAKGEVLSIDFEAGTYSVTKFEAIAKLHARTATVSTNAASARSASAWKSERRGNAMVALRAGEGIELERTGEGSRNGERQQIRLVADQQLSLGRAAIEALLGTGYPNRRDDSADAILSALRTSRGATAATNSSSAAAAEGEYHLPLQYNVRVDVGGETVEVRNVVLRIGNELAPPDVLAVPPGATLVDSDVVTAQRMLEELDGASRSQNR
jgi:hypothetical protein